MADKNAISAEMGQLAVLWMRAQPATNAFIRSAIFATQDAEEILQDVAATVVEKYDQFDQSRPFTPWVIGIARLKVLEYLRSRSRDRHVFDSDTLALIADAHAQTSATYEERKQALAKCMKRLQGRGSKAIEMRYLREMKTPEIAERLGISSNAVFILLHRTRLALSKCIERHIAEDERGMP
jgi:RNA polymerase sigma-70 factor (ECF subfamily)